MSDFINLEKGQKITLDKKAPGETVFRIGLGWREDPNVDLDASAFACTYDASGAPRLENPDGLVFFGTQRFVTPEGQMYEGSRRSDQDLISSACGGIVHSGDNLTGVGSGDDDEVITVDLSKLDKKYQQIDIFVTIYNAAAKGQNFGIVRDAEVNLYDGSNTKIGHFDLTDDDASVGISLHFVSLFLENGAWKFQVIGNVSKNDLGALVKLYNPTLATKGNG